MFGTQWSNIQNKRLYYIIGKNNKVDSLKISDQAQKILDFYLPSKDDTGLVFPELKGLENLSDNYAVQVHIKTKLGQINKLLKEVARKAKVTKRISMHISRHTFGNIAGDKMLPQMLQKLYRHSNISTTVGYQAAFINKSADDALDNVIG